MLGLADRLLGEFAGGAEVDLPLDAGFRQPEIRLRNLGRVVEQGPAARVEESVTLGQFQVVAEPEAQLRHMEGNAALRGRDIASAKPPCGALPRPRSARAAADLHGGRRAADVVSGDTSPVRVTRLPSSVFSIVTAARSSGVRSNALKSSAKSRTVGGGRIRSNSGFLRRRANRAALGHFFDKGVGLAVLEAHVDKPIVQLRDGVRP